MKTACFLILAVLCLLPNAALAIERTRIALPPTRPLTLSCVVDAARARGLPLAALLGILATENGRMGEALDNKNGTWDLGIAPEAVLRDGRVNAHAAAWLLHKEYQRIGDLWQAIGAYHSRTPHRRDAYIQRVKNNLVKLEREGIFTLPPFVANRESRP